MNIGKRQQGRVYGDTVINTDEGYESIYSAISRALNPEFRDICAGSINPYGLGKASDRIVDVIERTDLRVLFSSYSTTSRCRNESWIRLC